MGERDARIGPDRMGELRPGFRCWPRLSAQVRMVDEDDPCLMSLDGNVGEGG